MPIDPLSTPLGRLHSLLSDYEGIRLAMGEGASLRQVWAEVLGVQPERVPLELAKVGSDLLPAAEAQVLDADDLDQQIIWDEHKAEWRAPILHENAGLDSTASNVPARNVIYLAGLWKGLRLPDLVEGRTPTQSEVDHLIIELQTIRDAVERDTDLPPVVRSAMARRLGDLVDALADLRTTGPGGAQAAAQRILGEVIIAKANAGRNFPLLQRILAGAWTAYLAVAPLGDAVTSVGIIESTVETVVGEIIEHIPGELSQRSEEPGAVTDGTGHP